MNWVWEKSPAGILSLGYRSTIGTTELLKLIEVGQDHFEIGIDSEIEAD